MTNAASRDRTDRESAQDSRPDKARSGPKEAGTNQCVTTEGGPDKGPDAADHRSPEDNGADDVCLSDGGELGEKSSNSNKLDNQRAEDPLPDSPPPAGKGDPAPDLDPDGHRQPEPAPTPEPETEPEPAPALTPWDLWEHAWRQLDTAQTLLCQGTALDAARHIYDGWHALASVGALLNGDSPPELAHVRRSLAPRLFAPRWPLGLTRFAHRLTSRWEESFCEVWQASLLDPVDAAGFARWPRARRRQLMWAARVQHRALERALRRQRWRFGLTPRLLGPLDRRRWLLLPLGLVCLAALLALGWWTRGPQTTAPGRTGTPRTVQGPAPTVGSPRSMVKLSRLTRRKARGTHWNAAGNVIFGEQLTVTLPKVMRPKRIEVSLDNNDTYQFNFILKDKEVGRLTFGPNMAEGGMVTYYDDVPAAARSGGVEAIVISVTAGDPAHSVGHLLLFP